MKLKIVLIEEEYKKDERMPISLLEGALSIQMSLLLSVLKGLNFIEKYETVTVEGKPDEIHVYPKKLENVELVAERITSEILGHNMTVKFIRDQRKARLAELIRVSQ